MEWNTMKSRLYAMFWGKMVYGVIDRYFSLFLEGLKIFLNRRLSLIVPVKQPYSIIFWTCDIITVQRNLSWRLHSMPRRCFVGSNNFMRSWKQLIIGRMRTPVRDPFSYGIRHIHCDSMKYDLMLHWITMNMLYLVPYPLWKCLPYRETHPPYY